MAEATLLPQNSTPWELAVSETDAARWPLPANLVKDVDNPWTCPVELLPYLAAGLGLEIWHDEWPEERKRAVVADIWRLKRNKTKLKGIKGYLALEGAGLISAARPRDKFWWSGGQSAEQRAATVADMPQIHIALKAPKAVAPRAKKFWGGRFVRQAWVAGKVWVASDAPARNAARATYVDRGVVTAVSIRGADDALGASMRVELRTPETTAKLTWGARRFWGRAAYTKSDASERVLGITPDLNAINFAVPSGLAPMTVRPARIHETVPAPVGKRFWGSRAKGGLVWGAGAVFTVSDADRHVYDQITLFDSTRLGPTRQPYSFWGVTRWGRAAFTAEMRVDVKLTRPSSQHGYRRPWGRGYWRKSDMSPLWRALAAAKASKAYRDTVWVDTRLYDPIRFSPGLRFGDGGFKNFGDTKRLT